MPLETPAAASQVRDQQTLGMEFGAWGGQGSQQDKPQAGGGAGTRLARQQHLAVLGDLPLQRFLEVGTCGSKTNTPTRQRPKLRRAPPGGHTGEASLEEAAKDRWA